MPNYYVNNNAQTTGEHEVHQEGCEYLQIAVSKKFLGFFIRCSDAIKEAKKYYSNVDGCKYCSSECHKK